MVGGLDLYLENVRPDAHVIINVAADAKGFSSFIFVLMKIYFYDAVLKSDEFGASAKIIEMGTFPPLFTVY